MDALGPAHAGIASGVNNAVSRTAGLVAIAALGIALAGVFDGALGRELAKAHVSPAARRALAGERAQIVAGHAPEGIASARDRALASGAIATAYAEGFRMTMLVSALLALLAAPVALDRSFRRLSASR
jgi:hypothetical protein